jgi:hypothetical protein
MSDIASIPHTELRYWSTPAGQRVAQLLKKLRSQEATEAAQFDQDCQTSFREYVTQNHRLSADATTSGFDTNCTDIASEFRRLNHSPQENSDEFHRLVDARHHAYALVLSRDRRSWSLDRLQSWCARYVDWLDQLEALLKITSLGRDAAKRGRDATDDYTAFWDIAAHIAPNVEPCPRPQQLMNVPHSQMKGEIERLSGWCIRQIALAKAVANELPPKPVQLMPTPSKPVLPDGFFNTYWFRYNGMEIDFSKYKSQHRLLGL